MTRTALLVWELGDGLGHVSRLLRIAERLREAGLRCRFAVRNLELAGHAVHLAGFEVLQAPMARVEPIVGPDGTQPVSLADVLGSIGFGRTERLAPFVAAWDALIDLAAPDVVVTDYAPTANLSLYGGRIPWVAIGDGFALPPFESERFPPFRAGRPAYDDAVLLDVIAQIQARRGRPVPARLPLLFEGTRRLVVTLPELDPWREARSEPPVGPIALPTRPVDVPPPESYFAYLSRGYAHTERVLEGLVLCARTGSVYLRDASAAQREQWRQRGLDLWDEPQDLRRMAERAAVVIHHGGIGTAEQVLSLGRPQLLVPRHFEQAANARSLGRLGVAVALRGGGRFTAEDIGRALTMADSEELRNRAAAWAKDLSKRPANALAAVVATCLGLVQN